MSPAQFHHREAFVPADKDLSIFYAQKRRVRCRSPPPVSEFQTKFRNSEDRIAQLRTYDWEVFNSDRRYYEHHADGGDYLEQLAADEEKPDVKTVSDFLDGIDSPALFSLLSETDPITDLIALRRSQG